MTRLSQRGRRMPSMSCSFRDVFSFRFSCFIAYHTAPCANVSCPKKKNLLPETKKLGETPLHTEPVLQLTRKVKRTRKRQRTLPPRIAGHIARHGSRLLHGQEDLWRTTRRSHGRLECEFGYLVSVHEYHSSSSSSSRKRL